MGRVSRHILCFVCSAPEASYCWASSSVHKFNPYDLADRSCRQCHLLPRWPVTTSFYTGLLTLPRGAVKVLTPCSLTALALGKGLVAGIATCSLLVWDDCPDCPQGLAHSCHSHLRYTLRGMAKQNKHTTVVCTTPQFVDCHSKSVCQCSQLISRQKTICIMWRETYSLNQYWSNVSLKLNLK